MQNYITKLCALSSHFEKTLQQAAQLSNRALNFLHDLIPSKKWLDLSSYLLSRPNYLITSLSGKVLVIYKNWLTKWLDLSTPKVRIALGLLAVICLLGISSLALAGGEDILKGTDASLIATLNGSGKKYIYLIEGFLSLAMYIKTKNLMVLFGIVIVAVFFNIILKVAGAA